MRILLKYLNLLGGKKMNKAELIAAVAAQTGETKKGAEATINAFVNTVMETLEKEQLEKEETHKLKKK